MPVDRKCCARGCDSVYHRDRGLKFFEVPKDPMYASKWMENLRLEKEEYSNHLYVCSLHFQKKEMGNRLKKHAIPTMNMDAAKWINKEHVYGGIDLEPGREGGTWLALGGHGGVFKIGALLNLTGEPKPRNAIAIHHNPIMHLNHNNNKADGTFPTTTSPILPAVTSSHLLHNEQFLLGRGMIVSDFVASTDECNIQTYNRKLLADCTKYSAFNFVSIEIGDTKTPAHISLLSNLPPSLEHYVENKCYGFGNSLAAVPLQKVINGRQRFETIVNDFHSKLAATAHIECINDESQQMELVTNLKNLLKCKQKFWPDAELQRRAPNWGEQMSALNVNIPHAAYGSRTHTVILIDEHNKMHFYEETMTGLDPEGEWRHVHIEKKFFDSTNASNGNHKL